MKKIFNVIFLLLILSTPGIAQQKIGTQEVDAVIEHYVAALNGHSVPAIMAFWADDGDLVSVTGQWAAGKQEVERMMTTLQTAVISEATYNVGRHWVRFIKPDVAIVDWQSTVSGMKGPAGKMLGPQRQHVTFLVVKRAGSWKFVMMRPGSFSPAPPPDQQQQ